MTSLALGSFLGFQDQIWFSILLREPLVTTNICIPPLNLQDYHGMLVVVLPGHYGWVGLLVVLQLGRTIHCFPPLEACITCSSSTKTSPQEGAFQVRSTQSPSQVFFPKCMMSLAIRTTINIWEANTGNSNSLYCLGVSWNPMTNKRRVSHAWDWGFCYNMSMAHGRSFVSPGDITSFKLYAHRFVCVICYLG